MKDLLKVYGKVYGKGMKKQYSEPKIYCGGGNIKDWHNKTPDEQVIALKKAWYLYYSFRNPATGILERQNPIKLGNRYKSKEERYKVLKKGQQILSEILADGYNPFLSNQSEAKERIEDDKLTVEEALKKVLEIKKQSISERYAYALQRTADGFIAYLKDRNQNVLSDISKITRKIVIAYLNHILITVSPKTRNDEKTHLNGLFTELENQGVIEHNFIDTIPNAKRDKKRSRTYSSKMVQEIDSYLEKEDKQMLLFIKFVSYLFLRPVEIVRLTVEDINLHDNLIEDKTKTKSLKTKLIPSILRNDLQEYLTQYPNTTKTDFLFTNKGIGKWDRKEDGRRSYFTNKYRDHVKKPLDISSDYNIYSFRHTYTTKMYKHIISKGKSKTEALDELSLITGHTSDAILAYIHDLDAELPKDYSEGLVW